MRSAEAILSIIRERGKRGLPLYDVYRQLYNRELYLLAYGRIYRNNGAMTPGVTAETVDGMSMAKIDSIIEQLRFERFRWRPTRRIYIEKKNTTTTTTTKIKKRPLGIPTWTDRLMGEVIRLILDAYYDPQFSDHSHGFRPNRGCHTALSEIRHLWQGTTWFIEGDISQCFDKLDHSVLMQTLTEKIHDNRFLRLLNGALKAGYLEEWKFNRTLSGTPQGGIVSPILANIYLDKVDRFVETTLLPEYNRGSRRKRSPEYQSLRYYARKLREQGKWVEAKEVRRKQQSIPSYAIDHNFRRLRYIRYADDFLLGFVGPRREVEEIKRRIGEFLRDNLKLQLSEEKTLITHARTETARFLGYELLVFQDDRKHAKGQRPVSQRTINGHIGLRVPAQVIRDKCRPYMKGGKPIHRAERLNDNEFSIVALYQAEYRGIVNYYQMAYNLSKLHRLKWVMETSLTKTLAHKMKVSVNRIYARYLTQVETAHGPLKAIQVTMQTVQREGDGKKPLVATWGGISLRWKANVVLNDDPPKVWNDRRTEVVERLLADTCELCGSHDHCQVHHIKALKDFQKPGRGPKPEWVQTMAARRRKTLVVCQTCHYDIHYPLSRQGARNEKRKTRRSTRHKTKETNTKC